MQDFIYIIISILGFLIGAVDIWLIIINIRQENTIKKLNETIQANNTVKCDDVQPILINYLNRGEGKSIRICYLSEILKAAIVVHTLKQRDFIKVQAKTLGIDIAGVYAMSELKSHLEPMDIVVDDWEMYSDNEKTFLTSRYNIRAVSFDSKNS